MLICNVFDLCPALFLHFKKLKNKNQEENVFFPSHINIILFAWQTLSVSRLLTKFSRILLFIAMIRHALTLPIWSMNNVATIQCTEPFSEENNNNKYLIRFQNLSYTSYTIKRMNVFCVILTVFGICMRSLDDIICGHEIKT